MEHENREKILHKFNENPKASGRSIAKKLKMPKSTVADVLKRFKETLTIGRAPHPSRKCGPKNKELAKKVTRSFKANPALSDRDRARRYGTSRSFVRRLRSDKGYKSYRMIKKPNRTDKQNSTAKSRARKLYDEVLKKFEGCILMDDETYVKCDYKQLPAHRFYTGNVRGGVPSKFKFQFQDKFAKKMLIWQALCSCGKKSRAFVTTSTLNADLYTKKCLNDRLLPLINSHKVPTKFWPDLASIHYARSTMAWYEANNVAVIPKRLNPPNCPELRPIEKYWGIVKRKLNKTGGAANTKAIMYQKWNKSAAEVTSMLVQKMMEGIKKKVREFFRNAD